MDTELKSKLKTLLQVNQQLNDKVRTLQNDLYDCVDAVELVFGKILTKEGKISMQKAMQMIANPASLETALSKLILAIEKHGKTQRPK